MASVEILQQAPLVACVPHQSAPEAVHEALLRHVTSINLDSCTAGDEDSFFVADLGEVVRAYERWTAHLPSVQAHYAVKCNTDEMVLRTLGNMGCNFDCALKNEIDTVLRLGFDASRIVYANPCKTNSFIRHARENGVDMTTVDNVQELHKIHAQHPLCQVLLRVATDDETAQCRLSTKFGCSVMSCVQDLLPVCRTLGIAVAGVAFHVGSGARDFGLITKAVRDARVLFDAAREFGFQMDVLDIGGGFEYDTFGESSRVVTEALEKHFPPKYREKSAIRVIAEPGRFMVSRAFTLAAHVIARRDMHTSLNGMLYLNDGVYGNLNCILFDHQTPVARLLRHRKEAFPAGEKKFRFSVWGPTCDGLDCISAEMAFERDVQVGDWVYFSHLGAYTSVASTSFNGFSGRARVRYIAPNGEAMDSY